MQAGGKRMNVLTGGIEQQIMLTDWGPGQSRHVKGDQLQR
jgi:hypothetical protein